MSGPAVHVDTLFFCKFDTPRLTGGGGGGGFKFAEKQQITLYLITLGLALYLNNLSPVITSKYCITPIFRVEEIFAIFANGISRNIPPAKFTSREIFLPAKIKF